MLLFFFLVWVLRVIHNSDIFEKLRPPWGFKSLNLNFRHRCLLFLLPLPLILGTLSQIYLSFLVSSISILPVSLYPKKCTILLLCLLVPTHENMPEHIDHVLVWTHTIHHTIQQHYTKTYNSRCQNDRGARNHYIISLGVGQQCFFCL